MKAGILEALTKGVSAKRTTVVATRLSNGAQLLLYPYESGHAAIPEPRDVKDAQDDKDNKGEGQSTAAALAASWGIDEQTWPHLLAELEESAREAARSDQSRVIEPSSLPHEEVFLHVYSPPLRLLIIGAVHLAQALCSVAGQCGFAVTVIDPRTAFATEARFPGVTLSTLWPDEALSELGIDGRTAIVTLTHDPKLDEPALETALKSPALYIGALGSKKTHRARCERLLAAGIEEAALTRIHGPVGLDIGARATGEIAVSIMAEIVSVLRSRDT